MTEEHSKMLEDQSKERLPVNINAEARDMLWRLAGPIAPHHNKKSILSRLAGSLGWGQRRVRAIFYLEARTITALEWRTLNERLDALKNQEKRAGELHDQLRQAYRDSGANGPLAR
jgi:hypothetical protein